VSDDEAEGVLDAAAEGVGAAEALDDKDAPGDAVALGERVGVSVARADADALIDAHGDAVSVVLNVAAAVAEGDADGSAVRDGLVDALGERVGESDAVSLAVGGGELDASGECDALADADSESVGVLDAEGEIEVVPHAVVVSEPDKLVSGSVVAESVAGVVGDGQPDSLTVPLAVTLADGDAAALADGEQLTTVHVMRRTL
jgi:hypothetical protein